MGGLFTSGGNVVNQIDVVAIVNNHIVFAILCVDLFPELNAVFEALARHFQSFGESGRGQRQYSYDYSRKTPPHGLFTAPS